MCCDDFYFTSRLKKYRSKRVSTKTSTEIINIWKKVSSGATPGYECFQSINTVKKKVNKLLIHNRSMVKAGESSTGKARNERRETFLKIRDILFDISKPDIKENLCAEDYDFNVDPQTNRKFTFGSVDKNVQRRLLRKRSREVAQQPREDKSAIEICLIKEIVTGLLEGISSSEPDSAGSETSKSFYIGNSWRKSARFRQTSCSKMNRHYLSSCFSSRQAPNFKQCVKRYPGCYHHRK